MYTDPTSTERRAPVLARLGTLAALMSLAVACGGSHGKAAAVTAKTGTPNPQAAKSVVAKTASLVAALKTSDGGRLSASVEAIATTGPQQIAMAGRGLAPASTPPAGGQPVTVAGTSGSVSCDGTGCSYDMFSVGGFTYNGGITASTAGDTTTVVANISVQGSVSGSGPSGSASETVNWMISGTLTITPTSINGSLESSGSGDITSSSGKVSYEYENLIEYDHVTLDGSAKPTGGSVHARWSVTVSGSAQGSQAWEATVSFP